MMRLIADNLCEYTHKGYQQSVSSFIIEDMLYTCVSALSSIINDETDCCILTKVISNQSHHLLLRTMQIHMYIACNADRAQHHLTTSHHTILLHCMLYTCVSALSSIINDETDC